jgi:uncharacterized alkaline shock family protein YloU
MAENKEYISREEELGHINISEEVLSAIAGAAALEVEGVACVSGGLDMEAVSKGGMRRLGKAVKADVKKEGVKVDMALDLVYGYSIPETCSKVQNRVRAAIENMTGLEVKDVNIRVAGITSNE